MQMCAKHDFYTYAYAYRSSTSFVMLTSDAALFVAQSNIDRRLPKIRRQQRRACKCAQRMNFIRMHNAYSSSTTITMLTSDVAPFATAVTPSNIDCRSPPSSIVRSAARSLATFDRPVARQFVGGLGPPSSLALSLDRSCRRSANQPRRSGKLKHNRSASHLKPACGAITARTVPATAPGDAAPSQPVRQAILELFALLLNEIAFSLWLEGLFIAGFKLGATIEYVRRRSSHLDMIHRRDLVRVHETGSIALEWDKKVSQEKNNHPVGRRPSKQKHDKKNLRRPNYASDSYFTVPLGRGKRRTKKEHK